MIRRPPRSTQSRSSAASDVYKRQGESCMKTEELIEEIKGMTVMELAEVVKALEENSSSKALTTSASSMTVIPLISSINSSVFMQLSPPFAQAIMRFELVLVVPVLVPIL